jgi:hypothetical protein
MNSAQFQDQAQETLTELKNNLSHFMDRAQPFAEDAYNKSKEFYKNTMERLPDQSDRYLLLGAAGLTIGFIGYRIGKKRNQNSLIKQVTHSASEIKKDFKKDLSPDLSLMMNDLITPAFKFVKLWMFYKLST